jgi:hypothetical protein
MKQDQLADHERGVLQATWKEVGRVRSALSRIQSRCLRAEHATADHDLTYAEKLCKEAETELTKVLALPTILNYSRR